METLVETTALRAFAALVGIQTRYEDVFYQTHEASGKTLAAILTAMGFDVSTDEHVERSRTDFETRALERGLEPVHVFVTGGRIEVALVIPRKRPVAPRRWSLVAEDGSRRQGTFDPERLSKNEITGSTGIVYERMVLTIAENLADGYYDLTVYDEAAVSHSRLIVAPRACYLPEAMERQGLWGIAAHVYSLRSQRTRIAGDFRDLATFCSIVRKAGGSAVAVNPLHLLPRGARSPYGPSSRTYVNWAYLDVTELPGYEAPSEPSHKAATESELVDYEALYRERFGAARRAFDKFRQTENTIEAKAFARYAKAGGDELRKAAIFEVLAERYRKYVGADDWREWPAEFRDPNSEAIASFVREHEDEIAFSIYLQWQCDVQLERVAIACDDMPIGLYRDLAVGTQLGGVDTWLSTGALVHGASVGAPPDLLNPGQDWGVAPFHPLALRSEGYRSFAALLRANARHAGALRIDHVMGLLRLWWVPAGASASDGAYVSYALEEMLAVLALESHRAKCLIVGEDLGTVPPGLRDRLEEARVFSYRVLQFEHDETGFVAPHDYPTFALASTGTHDLPTMTGYWTDADIEKRSALRSAFGAAEIELDDDASIAFAAHMYLAQTPSLLLMLTLEDVLGITDQLNVPASTGEHPNWRHRSPVLLEKLANDERFERLTEALRTSGRAT